MPHPEYFSEIIDMDLRGRKHPDSNSIKI